MNIVYVFSSLAKIAGTERILINKMNYLTEFFGFDVTIITYEQGTHPFAFPLSSKVKHIDLNVRFLTLYQYPRLKRYCKSIQFESLLKGKICKIIRELAPDIIICTSYSNTEINIISKLKIDAVKIIESHISKKHTGNQYKFRNNILLSILARIENYFMKKSYKRFDAIVTLTQDDAKAWKNVTKIYSIPNIIEYIPAESSSCYNKTAISVGRLSEQKGFDILINAWNEVHKKHSDWKLSIYGNGNDKNVLINYIKQYQLDNIIEIKEPTSDIYKQYLDNSIYIMSSRYEGFGLVLIEAMSCGVPCISFDCPYGPREIIKDNVDGILVKKIDSHALADKICYLIENDKIRISMGKKSKEDVVRYLPKNIMPLWEKLFSDLIEQKKSLLLQKK